MSLKIGDKVIINKKTYPGSYTYADKIGTIKSIENGEWPYTVYFEQRHHGTFSENELIKIDCKLAEVLYGPN